VQASGGGGRLCRLAAKTRRRSCPDQRYSKQYFPDTHGHSPVQFMAMLPGRTFVSKTTSFEDFIFSPGYIGKGIRKVTARSSTDGAHTRLCFCEP
jgi:hypothetical protein